MSTQSQSESKNQVSLKLIIDKKGKRILYGEADKKFIDFLFTILSLPVGTVLSLISTEGMVGPLFNLYRSVDAMDVNYFESNKNKDNLLKPSVPTPTQSQLQNLLQMDSSFSPAPTRYYSCSTCHFRITDTFGKDCLTCTKSMYKNVSFVQGSGGAATSSNEGSGYVKGMVTYMVLDDLTVKPMSSMSSLAVFKEFNVEDVDQIEEKLVFLDANEGVKLLRASLHSPTVLTDLFLHHIDWQKYTKKRKRKDCRHRSS